MRLLITGGAGFIGSNFVRYILQKHPEDQIIVLDKLTYAGSTATIRDVVEKVEFVKGDICSRRLVNGIAKRVDAIVNFAAESHVDRSISGPRPFVMSNVLGAQTLLEAARRHDVERFEQISTDETYGSTERGSFGESDPLDPSSPYSASKAGADLLAMAYFKTYGLPVVITRSTNNFGPYQHPEKLIPKAITNALRGVPVPVYGDGRNVRDWIYVVDNCRAVDLVLRKGRSGEIYNVGAGNERMNIDIVNIILRELGKSSESIKFVADRPGHDVRYSLNCDRIRALGWAPEHGLEGALKSTVAWYRENEWWWAPLLGVRA